MTLAVIVAASVLLAAALHLELALFTPLPRRALRVLMYHRVSNAEADRGTVPISVLERQVAWFRARGYVLVSLGQVLASLDGGPPLPDRAVLLTFDDGTADAHDLLLPLLARLRAPAALFVVPGLAGSTREYAGPHERFLRADELRALAAAGVDIGLHTFEHRDLRTLTPAEIEADLRRCGEWLAREQIAFQPALAYPYGAYPRKDPVARAAFLEAVRRAGLVAAFRIGNRLNPLPLGAPLEIRRTEVRGDEPFWIFAWRVRTGRRRAF